MTVKELINELLDCKMGADVTVLVEIDKETIKDTMDRYGNCTYPLDDEIDVKTVDNMNTRVRITLKEFKR